MRRGARGTALSRLQGDPGAPLFILDDLRQDDHDGGHLVRAVLCGEQCCVGVPHVTSDGLGSCTGDQCLALRTNRVHACQRSHQSDRHLHLLELLLKLQSSILETLQRVVLHVGCVLLCLNSFLEFAVSHRFRALEPSVNMFKRCLFVPSRDAW